MKFKMLICAISTTGYLCPGLAYDLPALNLGSTSFYDGAPAPSGPGWYAQQYLTFIQSSRLNDGSGQKLPLPKQNVGLTASITQLVYQSPEKLYGITPGFTVLLPALVTARVDDGLGNAALKTTSGIGDLTLGVFAQFDPIMGAQGPIFSQRLELDVILPSGKYESVNAINPGSNFLSFNPHWAFTAWATPKLSFSGRLHYLWNGVNNKPNVAFGPAAANTQAGQAVHANFTAEYAVQPGFSIGLNGYALQQTTDTRVNGAAVGGRKESVWALGPGLLYSFSRDTSMFVNLYSEAGARNRAEGSRLSLRLVHHFK